MQNKPCQKACERLMKYLADPTSSQEMLSLAVRHIAQCRNCQQRFQRLLTATIHDVSDDTAFCPYEVWIPAFVAMEIQGKAAATPWREVAEHLKTCAGCATRYTELMALHDDAEQGVVPLHYPEPDLSFLETEPEPETTLPPFWYVDRLGQLIVEFSNTVLRRLQMPLQPVAVGLKTAATSQVLFEVTLSESREDLDVTITAEKPAGETSDICTVIVEVKIPGRGGWPNLGGTQVTLNRGQETLATRQTDAFGKAVFPHIALNALPELSIQITPAAGRASPPA